MKTTIIITLFLITLSSCNNTPEEKKSPSPISPLVGELTKLKGTVIKNNQTLKLGNSVVEGDVIETKEKSFAQLKMSDETLINISANSKILLKEYKIDKDQRVVNINLLIGKIRTHFQKKLTGDKGSLKVTTKTTSFGVRGTEFITENSLNGKTKMFLLEGKVVLSKKNKETQVVQEIEVKPMELVTTEEESEVIKTEVVKEEDLAVIIQDEEMNVKLESLKVEEVIAPSPVVESPKTTEAIRDSDTKVRNFLLSLEHGLKALPLKSEGKLVYFGDSPALVKNLAKDSRGQVISIDPSLDRGDKKYRVPVIGANGEKLYLPVSEQFLSALISKSSSLGVSVPRAEQFNSNSDRKPASFERLEEE